MRQVPLGGSESKPTFLRVSEGDTSGKKPVWDKHRYKRLIEQLEESENLRI